MAKGRKYIPRKAHSRRGDVLTKPKRIVPKARFLEKKKNGYRMEGERSVTAPPKKKNKR